MGEDILADRYYSRPRDGCFWERLSGFSGDIDDTIANEFISFDAGQWIVDIAETDLAFSTDAECGTWFPTPRPGPTGATITPGIWLVGEQIAAGTYRAMVQDGCFWQRLRGFSGVVSEDTIANDFVDTAGQQFVTISASDEGFETDDECGTWERSNTTAVSIEGMSRGEIERNADLDKRRHVR